jgi:MarR family transcriptional regulator, negative regulator of the multidrug operon emrRAB
MTRSYYEKGDKLYGCSVRTTRDARLANLLGALSTGLADGIHESTVAAAGLEGAAPAALIALLDFSPNGSVHALSQVVGLTHSGAVRLVDRLVGAGYVERGAGRNARSLTLTLTTTGAAVAHRVRAARHNTITQAIGQLSDSQRATLTELCESLISQLTQQRLQQRAAGVTPAGGALCRMCDFTTCGRDQGDCPVAQTAATLNH